MHVEGLPLVDAVALLSHPRLVKWCRYLLQSRDFLRLCRPLNSLACRLFASNIVWYKYHSWIREHREHVKDLSCISKDLCRVVLVDNNPFSFLLQPLNGVPCIPFSAGQPYDEQVQYRLITTAETQSRHLFLLSLSWTSNLTFVDVLQAYGGSPSASQASLVPKGC